MKIDTKQDFVDYAMKKFKKIDSPENFLFPTKLFEEIAGDIAYVLGGDVTAKQVLDILVEGEYKKENMNFSASYVTIPPSEQEILSKRVGLAEKCWGLRA